MRTITSLSEMRSLAASFRGEGRRIGFVPTMGFLHEGHLSLIRRCRAENDVVVASIFVNPTQFGPTEDLARYPRDRAGDSRKCEDTGVDILFLPEASEVYPPGPQVYVLVEELSGILEGAARPGHFRGVATVVAKLFSVVRPHRAYFGQKDYQQCAVIRRMTRGLDLDVDVVVMPTVREADGLAMSSRNVYLGPEQRKKATVLYRALKAGEELIRGGTQDPGAVRSRMRDVLSTEQGVEIDYAEAVDADTLAPLSSGQGNMVLLVAARIGTTRLIDNLLILC